MCEQTIRIGVVGCGAFARFVLPHYTQIPGLAIGAMADTVPEAARSLAEQYEVPWFSDSASLAVCEEVDLVYIGTPPSLHYPQAMEALRAGKHVVCEKPLAVSLEEADEMIALAREKDLLLAANLMQRYNPLADKVKQLVDSKVLGEPLHGYFENYACDEFLGPEHWFWDPAVSGGIFIEHAVHFFDLFESWLGEGRVEAAQRSLRPGSGLEDQVQCTVRYGDTVSVNHYHGFTQSGSMDRQELRLLFEKGDITLYEWIPTHATIRAVADKAGIEQLARIFPESEMRVEHEFPPSDRAVGARHKRFEADKKFEMIHGAHNDKSKCYADMVVAMMEDQLAWIRDRSHPRRLTEQNGRNSLAMAVEATRLARAEA